MVKEGLSGESGSVRAMRLAVLVAVAGAGLFSLAATADAGQGKQPRRLTIEAVDLSPSSVVAGESTMASVHVRNPKSHRSKTRHLLLKLKGDGPRGGGGPVLARTKVPRLAAKSSKVISVDAAIPPGTPPGDATLRSCLIHADSDRCGKAKLQTSLTVLAPAELAVTPTAHDFGTLATGSVEETTLTLENVGEATTGSISTSLAGANPGEFNTSDDTCEGQTLAAGDTCTLDVGFAPTTNGGKSATLQASASPGGSASTSLGGAGVPPASLGVTPSPHDFGTVATGTTTGTQTFTVTNNGGVASGTISTSLTGTDSGQFSKSSDNCDGQTLGVGESCTVDAAFAPTTTGVKSAGLQATATPGGTASASLTGTGANPANLTIAPTPHDFGTVATATTTAAQTFTVTNNGGVPSGTIATTLAGADPGQFSKSSDNCDGQTLAAGASCTVDAAFAPTSNGGKSAGLQVSASPGGTASASLTGTGANPANLTVSPTVHIFGDAATGTTTTTQTFTITNDGGVASGTISTSLTGADSDQYAKSSDNCDGQTLAAGASCTVDAAFAPTTTGPKVAALQASATPGGTAAASLKGRGADPASLTIAPSPHDFGSILNGGTTSAQTFTVTNTGGVPTGAIVTALTGTAPNQFAKSNDNCNGQTLSGGVSCTIDVAFAPTSSGAKSAGLQATAGPGGSTTASLSGTGLNPANLSVSPASKNFGNVLTGTTSGPQQFTLTNTGDVTSSAITTGLTGADADRFSISSDNCAGQTLAAGASCTLNISFTPSVDGTKNRVAFSATPSPDDTATAPLSGTGVPTAANLEINQNGSGNEPSSGWGSSFTRDVGTFPSGTGGGTTLYVWLRNTGAADAVISPNPVAVTFSNAIPRVSGVGAGSTCNVQGQAPMTNLNFTDVVVQGGSTCRIAILVRTVSPGAASIQFTITGAPGGSVSGTITGNGS